MPGGLSQLVSALYQKEVNPVNILIQRWPWTSPTSSLVTGLTITSGAFPAYSAWTQVVPAAIIPNPCWLTAIFCERPTTGGAVEVWGVDIATGAGAAEVSLSSNTINKQGIFSFSENWLSSVGSSFIPPYNLPYPIKINGAPRISAALAGLLVGGKAMFIAIQTATGVGI